MPFVRGMQGLLLLENVLQFVGAFVAFSIAIVSYKGVRQTRSSRSSGLRRLSSFWVPASCWRGYTASARWTLIPGLEVSLTTLLIAGLFLETAGYFFLAFSHMLDVFFDKRMGVMLVFFPLMAINQRASPWY